MCNAAAVTDDIKSLVGRLEMLVNIDFHIIELDLNLAEVDVNMFTAINNDLVNDGCGLYRGRLILPYEHLSRHQNELVD